jgi:1-acyl-sn-glycerol-3-phosphate acyltransferase
MTFKINSPSLLQHFAWVPLRLFGKFFCSFEIKGVKHLEKIKGNVILASNHGSELDPLMLVSALPYFSHILPLAFVSRSKDYYKQNPRGFLYGGRFFELMGAYPAYSGLNDYEKSLQHHLAAIRSGMSVCIFPVGKKHKIDKNKHARGGVSYLALKTGLPIIPAKIEGLGGYKIKDYLRRKTKITISFGEAVYADDIFINSTDKKLLKSHIECEKASVKLMKKIERM